MQVRFNTAYKTWSQIARFMGPTWNPHGSCRPEVGPFLAPWTLLSGHQSFAKASVLTISYRQVTSMKWLQLTICNGYSLYLKHTNILYYLLQVNYKDQTRNKHPNVPCPYIYSRKLSIRKYATVHYHYLWIWYGYWYSFFQFSKEQRHCTINGGLLHCSAWWQ